MPLGFVDGLEDLSSFTTNNLTIVSARNGKGLQAAINSNQGGDLRSYIIPPSLTMTVGFAYRPLQFRTPIHLVCQLCGDGSSVGGTKNVRVAHVTLGLTSDGGLEVRRGNFGGAAIATSLPGIFGLGAWHYLEVQCKTGSTTAGVVIVRVNNTEVINVTNANTLNGVYSTPQSATLHSLSLADWASTGSGGAMFDDLYILYGDNEAFLGDLVVEHVYPTGNGAKSEWRGSDGNSVDNYLLVDNTSTGSEYVQTPIEGLQDLYQMGNLGTVAASVHGVMHTASLDRPSQAGPARARLLSQGTTLTKAPQTINVSTSASLYNYMLARNPDTGAPWTPAEVNNLQSGVEYVNTPIPGTPGTDVLYEPFKTLAAWGGSGGIITVAGRTNQALRIV